MLKCVSQNFVQTPYDVQPKYELQDLVFTTFADRYTRSKEKR